MRYEVYYKGELWAKFNNWHQASYLGTNIMRVDVNAEPDDYTLLQIFKYSVWDDIGNWIKKTFLKKSLILAHILPSYQVIVWSKIKQTYVYV